VPKDCNASNPVVVKRLNPVVRVSIEGLRAFVKHAFLPFAIVVVGFLQKFINLDGIWRGTSKLLYTLITVGFVLVAIVSIFLKLLL
jgi:hypothetical protein